MGEFDAKEAVVTEIEEKLHKPIKQGKTTGNALAFSHFPT